MSKQSIGFSIGMPVYNGSKFISFAIESLLNQSFSDFELIISDNASTDATEEICRFYAKKDSRIRYYRQEINIGAISNFKFVLDSAISPHFMWAAADDIWHPEWIEKLLPLVKIKNCIAFGKVQTIDENGNNVQHPVNGRKLSYSGNIFKRRLQYFLEPDFLGKANPIYGIFPRSIISNNVFNSLNISYSNSDTFLLFEVLNKNSIMSDDFVILFKRVHEDCVGGGITNNKNKMHLLKSFYNFFIGEPRNQFIKLTSYLKRANVVEKVVYFLFFPYMIILNYYYLIRNRLTL